MKRRRKYFVQPSTQLRFIATTMLATLSMSLFCTYFLNRGSEFVVEEGREKSIGPISSMSQIIMSLEKESHPKDTAAKVTSLKNELHSLKEIMETQYADTVEQWNQAERIILAVLFCFLLCTGLLVLMYSHRIAGPMVRIRTALEMLCEGKDIPPVRLRKHDEFKEVAGALDKLRTKLVERGFLESER